MAKLPPGLVPRLLSREAAAFYCGMSRNHFAAYIEPAVTTRAFGGKRLWDRHEIDRWLDGSHGEGHAQRSGEDWLERV